MDFSNWPEPKRTRYPWGIEQKDRGHVITFWRRDIKHLGRLHPRVYFNVTGASTRRLQRAIGHILHKPIRFPISGREYKV